MTGDGTMPVLLEVDGVSKSFPGVRALSDVSLTVRAGEIVALLGQNGSGKSTLVKILAGIYLPDEGRIHGSHLHFIHQDLGLIDSLTAVDNLGLDEGRGWAGLGPVRKAREQRAARAALADFGVEFDVDVPIATLTAAQRTIVAIARALRGWDDPTGNVLVLDEPTAALHGGEVLQLFTAIRSVTQAGAGVLFISHRLEEVVELASRVVVLRDGRLVADHPTEGLGTEDLAEMITGKRVDRGARKTTADNQPGPAGDAALTVRGLAGGSLRSLDLTLRSGEIVGVAGGLGSGREQIASLVYGAVPRSAGEVAVGGTPIGESPRAALTAGICYVPAERRTHGAVMDHTVSENIVLADLPHFTRAGIHLDGRRIRSIVGELCGDLQLRPMLIERPLGLFSGGNQQKVALGRWLRTGPAVFLVEEPTQGVDVGAADVIRQLILDAASEGAAVLVSTSDNADLTSMCTRVMVLRDGHVVAELTGDEISDHRLTHESLGIGAAQLSINP
ncbi:sugar ABC transporter ATP-binding protein [Rhodococcus sp. NPDC057529]|uniref:sugar ABC transporter ATP-binding protein n=1 Tax=Rhodococcus sp. NPDC057529 TaxID=3346158 RepID=UPI00366DC317